MVEISISLGRIKLPVLEMIETSERYVLRFLLPSSLDGSGISVSVDGDILRVYASGRNKEEGEGYQRSTYLNPNIDKESIESFFDKGILTIKLAKLRKGNFLDESGMKSLARPVHADTSAHTDPAVESEKPSDAESSAEEKTYPSDSFKDEGNEGDDGGTNTEGKESFPSADTEQHNSLPEKNIHPVEELQGVSTRELLSNLKTITIKSFTGVPITAEWWFGQVVCNRPVSWWWETWTIERIGCSDKYSLRSHHGKFLCAEPDGRVVANRDTAKDWEHWTVHRVGDGHFLKSFHGKYLRVIEDEVKTADWPDWHSEGAPHKWTLSAY